MAPRRELAVEPGGPSVTRLSSRRSRLGPIKPQRGAAPNRYQLIVAWVTLWPGSSTAEIATGLPLMALAELFESDWDARLLQFDRLLSRLEKVGRVVQREAGSASDLGWFPTRL